MMYTAILQIQQRVGKLIFTLISHIGDIDPGRSQRVVILNFARDLLVKDDAMASALENGKVGRYVTDFPNPKSWPPRLR